MKTKNFSLFSPSNLISIFSSEMSGMGTRSRHRPIQIVVRILSDEIEAAGDGFEHRILQTFFVEIVEAVFASREELERGWSEDRDHFG